MIHCDNEQTVDLVNKTALLISTKLCHVDIHQHWLRECIQDRVFNIEQLSMNEILADGLMKPLLCQKHENFV